MKLTFKNYFALLTAMLLFYTACNKTTITEPTTNNAAIASQIALNIARSLAGSYGGLNIQNTGFGSTKAAGVTINRSIAHSINRATCGFTTDSIVNFNTIVGDTVSHTGGSYILAWNCASDSVHVSIYTATDSITTTGTTSGSSFKYQVLQNYSIAPFNLSDKNLFVWGDLTSTINITYTNQAIKPTNIRAVYLLEGVTVNLNNNNNDITGKAFFSSVGSSNTSNWSIPSGTINFLGNHKADITINGTVYHADLITGVITS